MVRTYVDEAKILEKMAFSKKNASKKTKNVSLRNILLEDAAKRYENAGRNWVLEANQNKQYHRKVQYARLNAMNDYGLAKKIRGEINKANLEGQVFAIVSIISLASALFFTSLNLSGYATGSLANDTSLMGIVLFVLGLVFAFIFFKKKKK